MHNSENIQNGMLVITLVLAIAALVDGRYLRKNSAIILIAGIAYMFIVNVLVMAGLLWLGNVGYALYVRWVLLQPLLCWLGYIIAAMFFLWMMRKIPIGTLQTRRNSA
jgi:hypothetical protein